MTSEPIDLRHERERRIRAEMARVNAMHRLQVLDLADADEAIALLQDEVAGLKKGSPRS